jgi:ribosomal protein S12
MKVRFVDGKAVRSFIGGKGCPIGGHMACEEDDCY